MFHIARRVAPILGHLQRRASVEPAPSFYLSVAAHRRMRWSVAERMFGYKQYPLWALDRKLGGRELATLQGIASPRLLHDPASIENLDWDILPHQFVIKPDWGSSGDGVYLLKRHGKDFMDVVGRRWSREELAEHYKKLRDHGRKSGRVSETLFVEELITFEGEPAKDWKFYSFRGDFGLILQIDRHGQGMRYRHYDENWELVRNARYGRKDSATLKLPKYPELLAETARRLSRAIELPFARIDLMEGDQGVFFGEVTLTPGGGQRFRPSWDVHMGRMWEFAEEELRIGRDYYI